MSVQRLFLHVEDNIGVEVLPVDACLEVQMLSRGASGASGQCDGLSGFDCVATMYKVFEVVAVYRFQSEVMAYDDDIAVGAIRLGHPYYAALIKEMKKLGYVLTETDGCILEWNGERCPSDTSPCIDTYEDHLMAMAFAPACIPLGKLSINNPQVVSKSYPHFWDDLQATGFTINGKN